MTLRDANPEMAAIWDYERNGDATPDNTRGQANKKYFFKCTMGHSFDMELLHSMIRTEILWGVQFVGVQEENFL